LTSSPRGASPFNADIPLSTAIFHYSIFFFAISLDLCNYRKSLRKDHNHAAYDTTRPYRSVASEYDSRQRVGLLRPHSLIAFLRQFTFSQFFLRAAELLPASADQHKLSNDRV